MTKALTAGAVLLFFLGWPPGAATQPFHEIRVADRTIRLPADDWREILHPEPYARRFEARERRPGDVFPQVLTIVKLPMQFNERIGVALTPDEFVQFHFLYPVKTTFQAILDRSAFWVESVQTLEVPIGRLLPVAWGLHRPLARDETLALAEMYDAEVKRTRFRLRELF